MKSFEEIFGLRRALITGGLGFLGSTLAERLVQLGCEVTVVDSLIPEYGGNLFNVAGFEQKIRVNVSDVRDEHSMKYLVRNQDYLFNLAGQTSHMDSMRRPVSDLEINCHAQLSILEACREVNPEIKIIFASTRQLYGRPDYLPVDEKHLLRPVDVNGVNKMAGEGYHILYNNVYGIRACALRLTNTYGPRMRIKDARQTFLGIWIRQVIQNQPFEVWGGEQLRDFTYADDCVDAMLLAAASEKANGRIYNLGGCEVVNLAKLAEMLVQANRGGEFEVKTFPPDRKQIDIGDYYSDWGLIGEELGWSPRISLSEGLELSVGFYKKNLSHYL